jgi:methyl-accepting chemotaxis protein
MKLLTSLTGRFILLTLLFLAFSLWISLAFIDRLNQTVKFTEVQSSLTDLLNNSHKLELQIACLTNIRTVEDFETSGFSPERVEEYSFKIISGMNTLFTDQLLSEDFSLQRDFKQVQEGTGELTTLINTTTGLIREKGDINSGLIYQTLFRLESWTAAAPQALRPFLAAVFSDFNTYLAAPSPTLPEEILNRWEINKSALIASLPASIAVNGNPLTRDEAREDLLSLFGGIKTLAEIERKLGFYNNSGLRASMNLFINQVGENIISIRASYAGLAKEKSLGLNRSLIIVFAVFSLLFLVLILYFIGNNSKHTHKLNANLDMLAAGRIPNPLELPEDEEFRNLYDAINRHAENLRRKVRFSEQLGEGMSHEGSTLFSEEDELGSSLNKMSRSLALAREEDQNRKLQDQQRQWLNEGMARMGNILRSERENLAELAFNILKELVKYLDACQGALFVMKDDTSYEQQIELVAAFAYDRRKFLKKTILPGEGLVGLAAIEKDTIYISEVPADYSEISSGLGEAPPRCLLIVPLKVENEVFGILELASLNQLRDFEIAFVEQLGESIATSLAGVRINARTAQLLAQSQEQAREMAIQEEKMRRNMEELQRAQDESRYREIEMTGILNAINSSSLVAEFSPNGRFSDINEKFQILLESPREQIIGKHHSEFALTDKYSDEYKSFWKNLKEGQIITLNEKYRLYTGNEIWLKQTFTPVLNESGKVFKILCIASDISNTIQQQAFLEKQAAELSRRSGEMKSLSDAIDDSMLKCELSPEGIIMDLNSNYAEFTGYSSKEQLGKNIRLFLKDAEKEQFEKITETVIRDRPYSGVIRRTRPTGEELWLMSTFSPVRDEEGTIYKIYFLAQDITEKKLRYQLLEEANKEIERLKNKLNELENS